MVPNCTIHLAYIDARTCKDKEADGYSLCSHSLLHHSSGAWINTLGLQRTVGFFCFFLMGYYCSEKDMLKLVRIPKALCITVFL